MKPAGNLLILVQITLSHTRTTMVQDLKKISKSQIILFMRKQTMHCIQPLQ